MKKYTKENARELFCSGTIQIYKDCDDIELLEYVVGKLALNNFDYYNINGGCFNAIATCNTIKLSQIKNDKPKKMTFKYSDLQFKKDDITWRDYKWFDKTIELRFKPDYSKEVEALEKNAAEYGEKVIINFESI